VAPLGSVVRPLDEDDDAEIERALGLEPLRQHHRFPTEAENERALSLQSWQQHRSAPEVAVNDVRLIEEAWADLPHGNNSTRLKHPTVNKKQCGACKLIFREKLRLCSGCRSIRYCCSVCQRDDWPEHKRVCVPKKRVTAS